MAKKITSSIRAKYTTLLLVGVTIFGVFLGRKLYNLAAPPTKERDCNFSYPYTHASTTIQIDYRPLFTLSVPVVQTGGFINDASCLNKTAVYAIVKITSEEDILAALSYAREHNLTITPSGERHSMGGQSFSKGGLALDMRGYNAVTIDKEKMIAKVGSGASWKSVQAVLDKEGLAVKAMQSINIFSVGGTLSVNAHGVVHNPGQVGSTVRSMRVMLSTGEIVNVSKDENKELFGMVIGGYGLAGIILDVELDIVKNEAYVWKTEYINFKDFPDYYKTNIIDNPLVRLFYARLSISPSGYLEETAIHRYEEPDFAIEPEPLKPAQKVWLKRLIFNISKTGDIGKWVRWMTEKYLEPGVHTCISRNQALGTGHEEEVCFATRNQKMNQSMEYLNVRQKDTNILQEYFIPLENSVAFINDLKQLVRGEHLNLLNVALRVVTKDDISALPYATGERMAFVLYFNQKLNTEDSKRLEEATPKLIDLALKHGGRYYLPYQLFYSKEQLRTAYPESEAFFALKRKYDPGELFSNTFYETYKN